MIEIKSREDAERELGELGARLWCDTVLVDVYAHDRRFRFVRPKLKPLTNDELYFIFENNRAPGVIENILGLRAVINAHEKRRDEMRDRDRRRKGSACE